ncbi:MAG: Lrp/AsnC family transcriptional regulator [Candidatus Bathyarchaeota archaeon]|nr:Lrp/AsnC family transcriptional regulator [Candidatus Bathyarchaeum sp.]
MTSQLDSKDKKILNMLQENSRTSYLHIASKLGVSEATVRYRIKKLLDNRVISRFTVLLDPTKIGYPTTGILMVKIAPDHFEEASKQISALDETRHVLQSTGDYNLVAVVRSHDLEHLSDVRKKVELISGVREVTLFAATKLIKIDPSFML